MPKYFIVAIILAAILGASIAAKAGFDAAQEEAQAKKNKASVNLGLGGVAPGTFERIFIVQYENQPYFLVSRDPNFIKYAKKGVLLTNYYAVTHPSQPNYLAQSAFHFSITP
jgi:hypothetical protein